MIDLTEERLQEIEARAAKATPGPWEFTDGLIGTYIKGRFEYSCVCDCNAPDYQNKHEKDTNAAFIAAARQDVPDLVAEVRELMEQVATLTARNAKLAEALKEAKSELRDMWHDHPVMVKIDAALEASHD